MEMINVRVHAMHCLYLWMALIIESLDH